MKRILLLLFLLLTLPMGKLCADVPSEDRTATAAPSRRLPTGTWHRLDTAYEKEVLTLAVGGRITLGEPGLAACGRYRQRSTDTIEIDLRPQFGYQRLTCRWRVQDNILTLEVLQSASKADAGDDYRVLDMDRSLLGAVWRFKRVR